MSSTGPGAAIGFVPILIIALVFGAYLSLAITSAGASSSTTTSTSIATSVSSTSAPQGYHNLIFNQTGWCSPQVYLAPWAVSLSNGITIAQPSNATLPLPEKGVYTYSQAYTNYSVITFRVSDGIYNYNVYPKSEFPGQSSGTVIVKGADVTVQLSTIAVPCRSST
ncbi:MAG TPA: hypothetical protein VFF30_06075 [Nitrososphaerales archaeon]|nr:hypothetical protein [Nitrososphaerales archaeon]